MSVFPNSPGLMLICLGISRSIQECRICDFLPTRFGYQTFFCITGKQDVKCPAGD